MNPFSIEFCPGHGRPRLQPVPVVMMVLCLAVLAALPGCRGCREDPETRKQREAKEQEKKREQPKPDFELGRLVTQPATGLALESWYKPGHWTSTMLAAKANNFDFLGELGLGVTDAQGRAAGLVAAPFELASFRPVAFPKGQQKSFESILFFPADGRQAWVSCRVQSRKGGRGVYEMRQPMLPMPSYQYCFVVLARQPERYAYLRGLDSIKGLSDSLSSDMPQPYYRLVLFPADRRAGLPSHGLFWTAIACVLWDDAPPDCLDLEQRRALLDWLHWGGQLIISGPDTLDTLRSSFLGPYLPAFAGRTCELTEADFAELNQRWTLPVRGRPGRRLAPIQPWTGLKLQKHAQAWFVPGCGELLAERRVGRGRVVVSAFRLNGRELTSWRPGLDGFVNACLLRLPARRFRFDENQVRLQILWAGSRGDRLDLQRICKLHYFVRDTGVESADHASDISSVGLDSDQRTQGPSVAAWNDFNPVARSARTALRDAARLEIPASSFVVWMVAGYLLVLVPLNWLTFRTVGRVEWAWAAAPVIAVACALLVIRLAQLDIGFARSQTEIAVVELQGDYPRAHVTRYTALYSSLATAYDFRFTKDAGALVQPFPTVAGPEQFRLLPGQGRTRLHYGRDEETTLSGFSASSNSIGLVHSEQLVDLGGPVMLAQDAGGGDQVANHTRFTLHDAGVLRRTPSGRLQTAWLGTLAPGAIVAAQFGSHSEARADGRLWADQRSRCKVTQSDSPPGELSLRRLMDLAENAAELAPGDVRLVAWMDQRIPGLVIEPEAAQSRHAALLTAHLQYGPGLHPQPDQNTRGDVERVDDTFREAEENAEHGILP